MYTTSNIKKEDLGKIEVPNQNIIIKYFQEPLDLQQAWEIIKKESNQFKEEVPLAMKADQLLSQLLEENGMEIVNPAEEKTSTDDIDAEVLALELELIEIELELELESKTT